MKFLIKIERAKKALSHLYGPGYQASEEVEIIRRHLEHHAKASGNQSLKSFFIYFEISSNSQQSIYTNNVLQYIHTFRNGKAAKLGFSNLGSHKKIQKQSRSLQTFLHCNISYIHPAI